MCRAMSTEAERTVWSWKNFGLIKRRNRNRPVYGGAAGIPGERLVYGGSTVNMTGGWVRGNVYGGSELSNDGPEEDRQDDLVFVQPDRGLGERQRLWRRLPGSHSWFHASAYRQRGALGECSYHMAHQGSSRNLHFLRAYSGRFGLCGRRLRRRKHGGLFCHHGNQDFSCLY